MWETQSVQISVSLPRDVARQAEEVQETDPEFLSRVVLYGLTRRSIYQHLRAQGGSSDPEWGGVTPPPPPENVWGG